MSEHTENVKIETSTPQTREEPVYSDRAGFARERNYERE